MEKELVETFLTVAKINNISKAAQLLYVSQTTVSYRLKLLEEKLGTKLIYRNKGSKRTSLTMQGKRLLPLAQTWFNTNQAFENFNTHSDLLALRIGGVNSINHYLLRGFYRSLTLDKLSWKLEIKTSHTHTIYEQLQLNDMDIGLVLEENPQPNLHIQKIYSAPLSVITLASSPLRNSVSMEDLDPNLQIYFNWGPNYRKWHHLHIPNWAEPRFSVDSVAIALDLLEPGSWFFAPQFIRTFLEKQNLPYTMTPLNTTPPTYDVYMVSETANEQRKRYEVVLFKRRLLQFLRRKK